MEHAEGDGVRFVGIIQSRLDSTRLPGKALIEVQGRALIDFVIQRTAAVRGLDEYVVASTLRPTDDELVSYVERASVKCFRGDAFDVARRLLDCAIACKADYFVRINGDSVFIDPDLIDMGIDVCRTRLPDLVTNVLFRSYPYGVSVEIIRTAAFSEAYGKLSTDYEREHVTTCFYRDPHRWRIVNLHSGMPHDQRVRLVVDTAEDLEKFRRLVKALGEAAITANYTRVVDTYLSLQESDL